MPRDWGEAPDVLDFIIGWLHERYESQPLVARAFRAFLEKTGGRGGTIPAEPRISFAAKAPKSVVELDEIAADAVAAVYISSDDSLGSFARGIDVGNFEALLAGLRRWVDETEEELIGNSANYGQAPWVRFTVGTLRCVLNADTKRSGVEEVLRRAGKTPFRVDVGPNTRGRCVKLLFDGEAIPGFYAYTSDEQPGPALLHEQE